MDIHQTRQLNSISKLIDKSMSYCTTYEMTKKGFKLEFESIGKLNEQDLRAIFGQEVKTKNY